MNYRLTGLIIILFLTNIILSLYVFSNGFLIRRLSLNQTNLKSNLEFKKFNKSIILFIDALRFDFVFKSDINKYFGLSSLQKLIQNKPTKAKLFKFIADPPTTTMQRIKALMTGTLPTFIDAGSNFDSYKIEEDNLIRQFNLKNNTIVILGDDTWLSLFDESLINQHFTYPSFNIKDLDTNDINVDQKLRTLLNNKDKNNMIIAHFLGIDHCGHTFGPNSPVLKRKLNDIDGSIKYVVESIDNDTLLVIIGDHGMTETGDHGGDSINEIETVLFFYSKKDLFKNEFLNAKNDLSNVSYQKIPQINLTPTLALLLGLSIPFSNVGVIIESLFKDDEKIKAFKENYEQVKEFVHNYESYEKLLENSIFENLKEFKNITQYKSTLEKIQESCRNKWSTFNLKYCLIGLSCIFLSIISFFCYFKISQHKSFQSDKVEIKLLRDSFYIIILYSFLSLVFKWNFFSNIWLYCLLFNFKFLKKNLKTLHNLIFDFTKLFRFDYLILFLIYLIPFSNSYIIRENNSIRFLLNSLVYFDIFLNLKSNIYRVITLAFILLISRFSNIFYVCREETLKFCENSIFSEQLQKNNFSKSFNITFIFSNFICVFFIFLFLKPKSLILNILSVFNLCIIFFYNFLQLEIKETESLLDKNFNKLLISIGLICSRAVYFIFFLNLFIICKKLTWKHLNNCFYKEKNCYFILNFIIFESLILSQSQLSIWLLHLILYLYLKDARPKRANSIVFIILLEHYYFYATGHESTFTHIKWESGFHGFFGDNNNYLIRFFMAILILCNTFGSTIISVFHLYFVNEATTPEKIFKNLLTNTVVQYCLINSLKIFFNGISVFVLRRHLMVWKIFAPKFLFEAIKLIIGFLSCLVICIINYNQ